MKEKRFIHEKAAIKGAMMDAKIITDTQTGVQYLFTSSEPVFKTI